MTKLRTDKKTHTFRGAAAFITAAFLVMLFTGCPNANGNKPTPSSKYMVTFSVDGGGTLTAKIGETEIKSGNEVEANKTVTFTATPSDNYEVDKWTITGSAFETGTGTGGSITAKVKITATVNITVSFKLNKYPVTFSVDGAGGTLKAKADGETEINSGDKVEHGKTVTFTATPATGYRVKGWTLDGTAIAEAGTNTEYTLTVTKPTAVTVSFEPKKALLTLEAGKNTVKVKAKTADGKPITVEGCTVTELANEAETTLTAKVAGTQIALIGELTELNCRGSEDASNRPLVALDVSGCTALQKLDCAKNQLTALNVQGLKDLQELNCRSNQIPELDVHGLTALQKLNCTGNKLTTLNVQGLTALKELDCQSNKELTALHVHGCTALQKLNCQYNKIAELDVSGLTALQELDCNTNQLKTLHVHGCTALQELDCQYNQIPELNVQGLTKLQQLYCSNNQLTALNVQSCTALKKLECFQNKLNADAFTKLFNDLPAREVSDKAKALLYKERKANEENCKDFSQPESLKKAFEGAKAKHWKMQKANHFGFGEDI